jgi:hypothetical protein
MPSAALPVIITAAYYYIDDAVRPSGWLMTISNLVSTACAGTERAVDRRQVVGSSRWRWRGALSSIIGASRRARRA